MLGDRPLLFISLSLPLAAGCPGGENLPSTTPDDSEPDTAADTDTDTDADSDTDTDWDPDDFYTVWDIGPGQELESPCDMAWEDVESGTLVRIHWREDPYRCKWVITTEAYEARPLVVMGIPDEDRLPVISGDGATTPTGMDYYNEVRSVIKIGNSEESNPDEQPVWVWLQDLDIRSASPSYSFTDADGLDQSYLPDAGAVHIEAGRQVHLRGLHLHDSANGLVVDEDASDTTVSHSWFYDNGIEDEWLMHHANTQTQGITFEYNRFDPLRDGAAGGALEDRSSGLVFRYNWVQGGNHQLELVDTVSETIRDAADYGTPFIYGNVFVEPADAGATELLIYGGDGSDESWFRKGTLYFFHNTVLSQRPDATTLLRLSSAGESVDFRNNVVHTSGGGRLWVLAGEGPVLMADNWLTEDWIEEATTEPSGLVDDQGTTSGKEPGFVDASNLDLHLAEGSPCQGIAGQNAAAASEHPVDSQYVDPRDSEERSTREDLGAFETGE